MKRLIILFVLAVFAGCGGGGGGGDSTTPTTLNLNAPSSLASSAISATHVNLSWTDNATNESGFKIERRTGLDGIFSQIGTTGANATTYSDTTALAATTYYYRICATNSSENSTYSNLTNTTTSSSRGGGVATDYFPTTVGSTWTYFVTEEGNNHQYTSTIKSNINNVFTMEDLFTSTEKVINTGSIVGNSIVISSQLIYGLLDTQETRTYSPGFNLYPASLQIGSTETQTVTVTSSKSGVSTMTRTVTIQGIESVTVAAGTFPTALKLLVTNPAYGSADTYWLVQNVGMVKHSGSASEQLVSYNIK